MAGAILCDWCHLTYPELPPEAPDSVITAGICPHCLEFARNNRASDLGGFLGRFEFPILCLDGEGRVVAANERALEDATTLREVQGKLAGDVLECRWARRPGGCGRTEHCVGCTIRRLALSTLETGEAHERVRAYLDRELANGQIVRLRLLVSTERWHDYVLLRFDELLADPAVA